MVLCSIFRRSFTEEMGEAEDDNDDTICLMGSSCGGCWLLSPSRMMAAKCEEEVSLPAQVESLLTLEF